MDAFDINKMKLWSNVQGMCEETPTLNAYIPKNKNTDYAVVIFPGGAYLRRAEHEGAGYAQFLANNGITAFVCDYRVSPHEFPLPLLDARRAVQLVRSMADEYGIDKRKVAVMGSSAGGHLAALVSTYFDEITYEKNDEIDTEDYIPNAQILCYPVIKLVSKKEGAHIASAKFLLGDKAMDMGEELTPEYIISEKTPPCFIWHTFDDREVSVVNSIDYVKQLRKHNVSSELHIFPHGEHGLGLAEGEKHTAQWSSLLLNWLDLIFDGNK